MGLVLTLLPQPQPPASLAPLVPSWLQLLLRCALIVVLVITATVLVCQSALSAILVRPLSLQRLHRVQSALKAVAQWT